MWQSATDISLSSEELVETGESVAFPVLVA
jgi:hypothetical protein